jgi:hypothetical protein
MFICSFARIWREKIANKYHYLRQYFCENYRVPYKALCSNSGLTLDKHDIFRGKEISGKCYILAKKGPELNSFPYKTLATFVPSLFSLTMF